MGKQVSLTSKNMQWSKYIIALIITSFVFILGIYAGSYTSNLKFESLSDLQNKIRSETIGTELQYQIVSDNPCSIFEPSLFTEDLNKIGSRLTEMESQLGVENKAVISLKEYYNLLEVRHFLFMKQALRECKKDYGLVLYFYSNAGDCKECQDQGYVLSYVNKKFPSFNIYSFDVNIDNAALKTLKKYYNVTVVPSIVINDKPYPGLRSREELYRAILNKTPEEIDGN